MTARMASSMHPIRVTLRSRRFPQQSIVWRSEEYEPDLSLAFSVVFPHRATIPFSRFQRNASSWLTLPAQPVNATPSNTLIRQCFLRRTNLFGCIWSVSSQGSVPADRTLASDLAFVFNASRVRPECCVDPLRPPP